MPVDYLSPRYWPTWLALALARMLTHLPWRWQLAIGRALGRIMYRLARRRRHIARINLQLCLPAQTEAERRQVLRKHFEALGMGALETAMSWWMPDHRLEPLCRIEGLENLQHALAQGRGVILLTAHFTTLEIGGRLLAMHAPFHVLFREHKNRLFHAVMRNAREINYEKAIPRGDMRAMLRSLRDNHPVWYAPDQNYGREHSIFVPFFGVPAATITATARIAQLSNAPVVPLFQALRSDGRGYLIRLDPALRHFPGSDIEAATRRVNGIIEDLIRRAPAQYLWTHRRFKTRPPGESSVYD